MKTAHLVRVEEPPAAFAALAAALGEAGLRLGWLERRSPEPLPPTLAAAAGLGALRAVAVGGGLTAAIKPVAGRPVLCDLLREHFLGCAVVLVHGGEGDESGPVVEVGGLPLLATAGEGKYRLACAGGERRFDPAALAARLRSPRPLAGGEGAPDAASANPVGGDAAR